VVDIHGQPGGEPVTAAPPAPSRRRGVRRASNPFELVVNSVWRYFASVRVAVYEIAFLALLTLIGTLKGSVVPEWLAERVPALSGLVDAWYGWDVFGSRLYTATLALIAIGIIVGGMLNRIPGLWATIVRPTVTTTRGFITGTAPHASVQREGAPDVPALAADAVAALRRRRYRVLTATVGDDVHVYADRNRFGKLGTFPFHIALVMVVVGGIIVTQYGFRDLQFVVAEGQTAEVGNGSDLRVRLDGFTDGYYQDGTPAEFRSDVTVFDGDDVLTSGSVVPNDPLSAGGVTLYQSGFGYNVALRVTDRAGNELFAGPVTLGEYEASTNPDAPAGQFTVPGTATTLTIIASDRDPANRPDLDTLNLPTQSIWVRATSPDTPPGVTPPTAIIDPTAPVTMGDVVVQFDRYGTYSVLQVAYYPALWLFAVASVIGIAGLAMTFYFPLRRIRAIVSTGPDGRATMLIAPLARRDWSGKRDFVRLVDDLGELAGTVVDLREEPGRRVPAGA
jgi:cytochrome c biogenesis protein